MASVNYRNAGTVEFIYDAEARQFYFLEVNTRLQVEHGVTEEVWGVDLVEWMLQQAAGELADLDTLKAALSPHGHAVQVRIYAEDPARTFALRQAAVAVQLAASEGLRIDHWIESGIEVPSLFDPMLAKVIVHAAGPRRPRSAIVSSALAESEIYGIETNLAYLQAILRSERCQRGELLTRSLAEFDFVLIRCRCWWPAHKPRCRTIRDGWALWHVGVPPSGPMDSLSFRLANRLLHNSADAAALEITLNGPTLQLQSRDADRTDAALLIEASLDGAAAADVYRQSRCAPGRCSSLGKVSWRWRARVSGGSRWLPVPGLPRLEIHLHARPVWRPRGARAARRRCPASAATRIPTASRRRHFAKRLPAHTATRTAAVIGSDWTLRVIYGPHGAPDFFTDDDISTFFATAWEVHYNSSRTGVRLNGPKPQWARETGGEAGLHPSNIHDNAYAFGTVDFTGDMPVILGPDGPSLGGFVCPATVITADLWKLGQLKAGATVRFAPVTLEQAVALEAAATGGH